MCAIVYNDEIFRHLKKEHNSFTSIYALIEEYHNSMHAWEDCTQQNVTQTNFIFYIFIIIMSFCSFLYSYYIQLIKYKKVFSAPLNMQYVKLTHDQLVSIKNLKTILDFRSGYINIDGFTIDDVNKLMYTITVDKCKYCNFNIILIILFDIYIYIYIYIYNMYIQYE